uniref:SGNH hydrolase-type esterase domain-containing protein n=1 Tax=Globisporangium ultimum (strain ATCC 200006 / CBS 805.95 / DAOM BR144) TaxID=431595 RepID=K3WL27_GLOUD
MDGWQRCRITDVLGVRNSPRWLVDYALPTFETEIKMQYAPTLVTVFLGANDAALTTGPNARQHVPLDEFRENLVHIIRSITPLLPPRAKILLITPPAVIDSTRSNGDRSNDAAGEYARACVDVASAENVAVVDLHTYFNSNYPVEGERKAFFSDGLHLSAQGNYVTAQLIEAAMNRILDAVDLAHIGGLQLPGFQSLPLAT